jgi:glutamyl-tRNA synthetase
MDEEVRERIEHEAEIKALVNALKHDGSADVGAVMGPLMADNPEFRDHGDAIPGVIAPIAARVNDLDREGQEKRLGALAPDRLSALETDDDGSETHPLPALPGIEDGETDDSDTGGPSSEVRMRLAPNPNGPWHLGNARMPAVIGTYKNRYDGWMCCRFDDTDPETKRPDLDAYDAILDSISYLGFEPDEVLRASDRLPIYYEHARELIDRGGAYTCSCAAADFSELKNNGEACPHREKSPETTRTEFDEMVAGEVNAGERVLRVRTDITHPNPALRDWVAFRMIDRPHPRQEASEYSCWPLLDFQSGIDDHLTGITHIIRGIDLQDSAKRQRFLYEYFDWEYPEVVHWGRIQVDAYDVSMSTSTISELIAAGGLTGWDDPRAPTIASLRRRGITGEAITEAMVGLGTSTSNADLAMSAIYAANRDRIDDRADRAFLVREKSERDDEIGAIERPVVGGPGSASPPIHPNHEERGDREIPVGDAVLIERVDHPAADERVWLKGYGCVRATDETFEWTGDDISAVREEGVPVVHWVPAEDNRPVVLKTPAGDVRGRAEPGIEAHDPDTVIQFERIGFARIDTQSNDRTLAYFTHS